MKANWIAGGLLLVLDPLWLTATAPARLLAPMLPPGVQAGQFSGSVWRGAAQPVYWHGERLERLAWSLTLAGWQVSLSDPRGVMGQARLWGLPRSAPTGGAAHRPRQPAQPLVDVDYARQGRGGGHLQPDRRAVQRRTLPAYHRRRRAVAAGPTALSGRQPGAGPG